MCRIIRNKATFQALFRGENRLKIQSNEKNKIQFFRSIKLDSCAKFAHKEKKRKEEMKMQIWFGLRTRKTNRLNGPSWTQESRQTVNKFCKNTKLKERRSHWLGGEVVTQRRRDEEDEEQGEAKTTDQKNLPLKQCPVACQRNGSLLCSGVWKTKCGGKDTQKLARKQSKCWWNRACPHLNTHTNTKQGKCKFCCRQKVANRPTFELFARQKKTRDRFQSTNGTWPRTNRLCVLENEREGGETFDSHFSACAKC